VARVAETVAEMNDALTDADITLRLSASNHPAASEAVFDVRLAGAPDWAPTLSLNVDSTGTARALLERDHHRDLLLATDLFELDKARIAELIISLLEAIYPPT
jgi:hypothetical protein